MGELNFEAQRNRGVTAVPSLPEMRRTPTASSRAQSPANAKAWAGKSRMNKMVSKRNMRTRA